MRTTGLATSKFTGSISLVVSADVFTTCADILEIEMIAKTSQCP